MDEYKQRNISAHCKKTPGDTGNMTMSHKGQGHTRGERLEDQNNEASKQKSVKVTEKHLVNK